MRVVVAEDGVLFREGLAALLEDAGEQVVARVGEADTLRVAGPRGETLLLWGWLQARLRRELALVHDPAGEVELVEIDGDEVPAPRAKRRSSSDLLSDQLEIFSRDRIYEEAVRGLAPVAA